MSASEKVILNDFNKLMLSAEEKRAIDTLNAISICEKGHILLREGEICSNYFYVLKGCVRQYYIKNGEERTVNFFTDNQSVIATANILKQSSKYYLECVETTELTITSETQQSEMYKRFPRFQELCRLASEKELADLNEKFATFLISSPEERYLNLLTNRPDLLRRVPQYQLASYLGVKPESLSRIRKRITLK